MIVTDTSNVAVSEAASVAVTRNVALRDSPELRPVAENVVAAELAESAVMDPPESFVHAYEYPPAPADAEAVTVAVVSDELDPFLVTDVGEAVTDSAALEFVQSTGTSIVYVELTVHLKTAETVAPAPTLVAENVVVALDALFALIEVDPDCRAQENVVPVPPTSEAVHEAVVMLPLAADADRLVGVAVA